MSELSKDVVRGWIETVLAHEGEYTQNPNDAGNWTGGNFGSGELKGTKYGISAAAYPELDIRNLTISKAVEIYAEDYAKPLELERFHPMLSEQLLDYAVNSGVHRAKKGLQRALSGVTSGGLVVDGIIGPKTMDAYLGVTPRNASILLLAERLRFMTKLSAWNDFGRGWAIRIAKNMEIVGDDES